MKDGMIREASKDPAVHRELVVLDPPMQGADVANAQRAVKLRIDARGLDVPTPTHGKWTHASAVAAVEAGYFIGLRSETYLAKMMVENKSGKRTPRLVFNIGAQRYVRNPGDRTTDMLDRAASRAAQLKKGSRYYDDLAKTLDIHSGSMEEALKWALSQVGKHETPSGSNWGHPVQDWAKLAGYVSPVPWCGCFVNAFLFHGGVKDGPGWIGYTPAIITHAKAGKNGWRWVSASEGQRGYIPLFDTPGGDPAVHVGGCLKRINSSTYQTVEGNTGGSNPADGGMVAVNTRSTVGNFRIIGFAVPPWK